MTEKKETMETVRTEKREPLYSKEQLLSSKRFCDRRDIVDALLDAQKQYTVNAVEKKIADYMKGKVN